MAGLALMEWEGKWVRIVLIGAGQGLERHTGRIEMVGSDGFILQPSDSPEHTLEPPRPMFFPLQHVLSVTLELQE